MNRIVTVLGGTGFLGRRIVRHLNEKDFTIRVATRNPDRASRLFAGGDRLQPIKADINNEDSLDAALAGAHAVVNAVSLYVEHGSETFQSVHVAGAERVASRARQQGVQRLVHISGIGADPASPSPYVSSRGKGEQAVSAAFASAVLIRPAVMFGPDDAFLNTIITLLRRLPIYPMFGWGQTKLQPVYVEDVAAGAVAALDRDHTAAFDCAGPRIYSYEQLLRTIAQTAGLRPILLPMPLTAWHTLAWAAEWLPKPPITRNQVELMGLYNVAHPGTPGLAELQVTATALEPVLQSMLGAERRQD